ncbi:MAG: DUF4349 domain-containing protein [Gaiellaceae bacterium]
MTPSPDLIHELQASRPAAPAALRARVRETARAQSYPGAWQRLRFPARRIALVALPAAAALALVSAGAIGLSRSEAPSSEALLEQASPEDSSGAKATPSTGLGVTSQDSAIGPTPERAQRVSATLTVEVEGSDDVSRAAQDALDLTRSLGGHVVSASVATGEQGSATMTLRVPVAKVQQAIARLSALGRIVSQQVTIDDLQESLDALERRESSVRAQIARITARLGTSSLDAETRAVLETRRQRLQRELRELRRGIATTTAEARMSTIELTVVTPESLGAVPVPSRLDRTLDEAVNVLLWEGVIVLALAIVIAPFVLVAIAAWLGQRLYRRREDERLLAQS